MFDDGPLVLSSKYVMIRQSHLLVVRAALLNGVVAYTDNKQELTFLTVLMSRVGCLPCFALRLYAMRAPPGAAGKPVTLVHCADEG